MIEYQVPGWCGDSSVLVLSHQELIQSPVHVFPPTGFNDASHSAIYANTPDIRDITPNPFKASDCFTSLYSMAELELQD